MEFDYTVEAGYSIHSTIQLLESHLKEEGFGILWIFNIKEKLQEKGLDFSDDYMVLEVCNPYEAERVLMENKRSGYFLPCKIVVYNDTEKTLIGFPRPTALVSVINNEAIKLLAKDIEERLIKCIDKTVENKVN
jgi:uncharacterized protein (DUF302 family)